MLRALLACMCCSFAFADQCKNMPIKLNQMVQDDQMVRQEMQTLRAMDKPDAKSMQVLNAKWARIDKANQTTLKQQLARCGWPKEEGARHNAWLITQHASQDRPFQRKVLGMLRAQTDLSVQQQVDIAYLEDRLNTQDEKPQQYGTQYQRPSRCEIRFFPMDQKEVVEARRKALGMMSLAQYEADAWQFMPPDCKRPDHLSQGKAVSR